MEEAFFAWSGGKDSALALYTILNQKQYRVKYLLTTVSEVHQRVTMHGTRLALLEEQARAIGIPLKIVWLPENADMAEYDSRMNAALMAFKEKGITTAIFGDIFLADLREYRENKLAQIGLKAAFPLWGEDSRQLVKTFIRLNFKAQLICVSDQQLGKAFLNLLLTDELLRALPPGVDAAGENGEYHTFVFAGPLFSQPIRFVEGEVILRDYSATQPQKPEDSTELLQINSNQETQPEVLDARFWFSDLLPVQD